MCAIFFVWVTHSGERVEGVDERVEGGETPPPIWGAGGMCGHLSLSHGVVPGPNYPLCGPHRRVLVKLTEPHRQEGTLRR